MPMAAKYVSMSCCEPRSLRAYGVRTREFRGQSLSFRGKLPNFRGQLPNFRWKSPNFRGPMLLALAVIVSLTWNSASHAFAQLLQRPTIPVDAAVVVECDDLRQVIMHARDHFAESPEFNAIVHTLQSPVTTAASAGAAKVVLKVLEQTLNQLLDLEHPLPIFAALSGKNTNPAFLVGFRIQGTQAEFLDYLREQLRSYRTQLRGAQIGLDVEFLEGEADDETTLQTLRIRLQAPLVPELLEPLEISWSLVDRWVVLCNDPGLLVQTLGGAVADVRTDRSYQTLIAQFSDRPRESGYVQLYVRPFFVRSQLPREWQALWQSLNLSDITGLGAQVTFPEASDRVTDETGVGRTVAIEARVNVTQPRSGIFTALDRIAPLNLPSVDYDEIVLLQAFSFDWNAVYSQFVRSYEAVNGPDSADFVETELINDMQLLQPGEQVTDLTESLAGVIGSMVMRSGTEFAPVRYFEFTSPETGLAFARRMSQAGTPYDRENPLTYHFDGVLHAWYRPESVFRKLYERNQAAYGDQTFEQAWQRDDGYYQRDEWFFMGRVADRERLMESSQRKLDASDVLERWGLEPNADGRFYISLTDGDFWQRRIQNAEYDLRGPLELGIVDYNEDGITRLTGLKAIDEAGLGIAEVWEILQGVATDQGFRLIQARFGEQIIEAFTEPSGLRVLVTFRPFIAERKKQ